MIYVLSSSDYKKSALLHISSRYTVTCFTLRMITMYGSLCTESNTTQRLNTKMAL